MLKCFISGTFPLLLPYDVNITVQMLWNRKIKGEDKYCVPVSVRPGVLSFVLMQELGVEIFPRKETVLYLEHHVFEDKLGVPTKT